MRNLVILLLTSVLLSACGINGVEGNGNVKERIRNVESFQGLQVSGRFDVYLMQGPSSGLTVIADENLHELIESRVENGVLIIRSTRSIYNAEELKLMISAAEFEELEFSGAVELRSKETISGKNLRLSVSGAAEVEMDLDYERLSADLSGASEIILTGKVRKVRFDASGASELSLSNLEVEEMDLDCSGACEADVFVTKTLSVDASGAAEIEYRGNPVITKSDLSGAASINSKN